MTEKKQVPHSVHAPVGRAGRIRCLIGRLFNMVPKADADWLINDAREEAARWKQRHKELATSRVSVTMDHRSLSEVASIRVITSDVRSPTERETLLRLVADEIRRQAKW